MTLYRALITAAAIFGSVAIAVSSATAQKRYDPGASDTEIKIGNTMPYSGPASNVGTVGRAEAAFFQMRNEHGGVNGRRITFISLDDGYNPAKIFEQVRKLVEQEHVIAIFGIIGTPTAAAVQRYLNNNKVPQVFGQSGATRFADPQHYPWTTPITPGYVDEARVYARYILETRPEPKVGILYQNDDYGKSYLTGLKEGFGSRATKIIEAAYEATDPTVASQIVSLHAWELTHPDKP
jgi:branched-chain amino acid transport system substrate-binding protein